MAYLIVRTIAILVTSYLTKVGVPIVFTATPILTAFVVAIALAIINNTIKPLISIAAFPITVITLGLFSFVINGAMVALAALVVPGFSIPSFFMAIIFAFVLSLVNWILHIFE